MHRKSLPIVLIVLLLTSIPALAAGLDGLGAGAATAKDGTHAPTLCGAPTPAAPQLAPGASTWNREAAADAAATPFNNAAGYQAPAAEALAE